MPPASPSFMPMLTCDYVKTVVVEDV